MIDSSVPSVVRRRRKLPQIRKLTLLAALRSQIWLMSRTSPDTAAARLADLFTTPPRPSVRHWEHRAMTQAQYSRRRFGNFGFLSVYRWRPDNAAPKGKVLVMHGFGGRASQLSGFAEALVAVGYEVVGFDAPGHGKSPKGHAALPDFVDALEMFAAQEGPFDTVIGHSMGGAALATALRLGMAAQRAVLIAPPVYPGTYLAQAGRMLGATEKVTGRAQALIEAQYGRAFDEFRTPLNASVLSQKALILHDRSDRQVPLAEGQLVAAAWRDADLEVTEGLGHTRILRDPGTVALVQKFLMQTA
ncbi:alpha/beta hydrolase [Shimia sagamensis]|uniref:Serine aminopeptidase, S33 n=1 Tax=Shimia sagamensis TaxID=1566352 RepID=A0ABY1NFH6_9RHOB|nr:alpha/beta fold hydrolase [Shimia sagamensis]SMP07873.1 Serine aminopeptidase, S33 [Shimia sagamensis]